MIKWNDVINEVGIYPAYYGLIFTLIGMFVFLYELHHLLWIDLFTLLAKILFIRWFMYCLPYRMFDMLWKL